MSRITTCNWVLSCYAICFVVFLLVIIESMSVTLNTGSAIPLVGLGCSRSKGEIIKRVISDAIDLGYRHFDCAAVYDNEEEIGQVFADKFQKGVVKREDVFITSKLAVSCMHPTQVEPALNRTLENLQLDYVDLYLIHWPFALHYDGPKNYFPADKEGNPLLDQSVDYVETWRKMEDTYRNGKAKAIGISNFNIHQVQRLLSQCAVVPAVHQIECHPFLTGNEMIEYCHEQHIHVTAYSPLASPENQQQNDAHNIFGNKVLRQIADRHGKTVAQVTLRFQVQRHTSVIPRSTNLSKMKSNLDVFDFDLTSDDCLMINSLNSELRRMCPSKFSNHVHFPFTKMQA